MKIRSFLRDVRLIRIPDEGTLVERTAAEEFHGFVHPRARIVAEKSSTEPGERNLSLSVQSSGDGKEWISLEIRDGQTAELKASRPSLLFAGARYVLDQLIDSEVDVPFTWKSQPAFTAVKSTFDLFLTQYARMIRNFDRERYVREHARLGFTHVEVNALAGPFPMEEGVPGEFYPDFYTYGPGLDQFVSSRLNYGLYPEEYLRANLERLKENAGLAAKYGLIPGLLCFEPRSVPEEFFKKYPTLRGARVDHPFRSFKPRFNLSTAHPVVCAHYAELVIRLLKEVPGLGFLAVWTNDSGSGFEHTKSLYVGRNGGAYLIREWKDDEDIARAAASNIIRFLRLLRDAGAAVNPSFRVVTRLESFSGERKYLWPELGDRVDVEVNSLLTSGWESLDPHPSYPDVKVLGSALHNTLSGSERRPLKEIESRKGRCYFYNFFGSHANTEPLLGIPFPWLVHEKLTACRKAGVTAIAPVGGLQPPDKVPYPVNQDVFRLCQFEPDLDAEEAVRRTAISYVGEGEAESLMEGWRLIDKAVRHMMPLSIYSGYGCVWQRVLVRPLAPDIDLIPEEERAYYESQMCTSLHNPNRVDFARDVLFELLSKDYARQAMTRIDRNVLGLLTEAVEFFGEKREDMKKQKRERPGSVFEDQYFRVRALRCLFTSLRNLAGWVYAVHHFLETVSPVEKNSCRRILDETMESEIANSREMIKLWSEASVEWMIVSGTKETPFIYGENFPELVRKKISLMEKHRNDEPHIDPNFMFRVEGNPYSSSPGS